MSALHVAAESADASEKSEALEYLRHALHPCAAELLGNEESAIALLTHCILRHPSGASIPPPSHRAAFHTAAEIAAASWVRRTALLLLYRLACHRPFCAVHFHANQSWTALAEAELRWQDAASTAGAAAADVWTLVALFCRLLVGPTRALVTAAHEQRLHQLMLTLCAASDSSTSEALITLLADGQSAMQAEMLNFAAVLAERGVVLPAQWLLAVAKASFRCTTRS